MLQRAHSPNPDNMIISDLPMYIIKYNKFESVIDYIIYIKLLEERIITTNVFVYNR